MLIGNVVNQDILIKVVRKRKDIAYFLDIYYIVFLTIFQCSL